METDNKKTKDFDKKEREQDIKNIHKDCALSRKHIIHKASDGT